MHDGRGATFAILAVCSVFLLSRDSLLLLRLLKSQQKLPEILRLRLTDNRERVRGGESATLEDKGSRARSSG